MHIVTVTELIPVLQIAVGPVVLISGIGLLILSMTNRFGRIIDRGRSLARELPETPRQDQAHLNEQMRILSRRAEYLRRAITAATVSVLLAAVLIIVILLMAMVSVMTYKLGLDRGVSVALFPMVIMAMTIERMSMVWEEFGPVEALKQGFGSLAVAVLGYLSMSSDYLGHLVFVFPELLLVVLALTLLLGRYTGYRLLELWRFRGALKG